MITEKNQTSRLAAQDRMVYERIGESLGQIYAVRPRDRSRLKWSREQAIRTVPNKEAFVYIFMAIANALNLRVTVLENTEEKMEVLFH